MNDGRADEGARIKVVDSGSFGPMVLHAKGRVAVEFMSYGCGHCRAIEPVLQRVADMTSANETFFRVDVTADPDLASAYAISGTPSFVMFLNGQEVGRSEGPSPTLASVQRAVTEPFAA